MERVSIYIDGANFYGGLTKINPRYTDSKFDFDKYITHIVGNRKIVNLYYYNSSLKQQINPNAFQRQQRLFERLKTQGFNVILCKRQQIRDDEGNTRFKIKGDDIHLAIDMLKDAYENKYDTALLISGDGDFSPLVEYVKNKGKKVENYHFKNCISLELVKECNKSIVIDKKIVNKFFFREEITIKDTEAGTILRNTDLKKE